MAHAITTVRIDEQGRTTIPKPAREKLDIVGETTTAELEVRVDE